VITKPLHHTQTLLKEDETGKVFSIRVILNYELERELLGFGDRLKVIEPQILVKQVKQQLQMAIDRYTIK
jgi:predicted DNA-binding transcriptional regulator YafY